MGYSERKLPKEWTEEMDSFICDCDARDVDPKVVVRTLKERFPVLKTVAVYISTPPLWPSHLPPLEHAGAPLVHESLTNECQGQISVNKIELRVKLLDQIPEIKYFKPGAVARYRQAVEEGRLKDKYPEDVAYLNSEEIMKDSVSAAHPRTCYPVLDPEVWTDAHHRSPQVCSAIKTATLIAAPAQPRV